MFITLCDLFSRGESHLISNISQSYKEDWKDIIGEQQCLLHIFPLLVIENVRC